MKDDENSIVAGLNVGADDYVTKPFSMRVLSSRIRAQLRRSNHFPAPRQQTIRYQINTLTHRFFVDGTEVPLTVTEFEIVRLLISRQGCLVTKEQILNATWDRHGHFVEENTLSVTISRLRRKLATQAAFPIETVHGLGYRWNEEEK